MKKYISELDMLCDPEDMEDVYDKLDDIPSLTYRNLLENNIEEKLSRSSDEYQAVAGTSFGVTRHLERAHKRGLPADLTQHQWETILTAFSHCCAYCGVSIGLTGLVIEHEVPISRGGGSTWNNILPACNMCNKSKGRHELLGWLERSFPHKHADILDNIKTVRQGLYEVFKC